MKKTIIALAVAGFSFNAAAVDFTNAAPATTSQTFAQEMKFKGDTNTTAVLATVLKDTMGFDKAGSDVYLRVELDNGAKLVKNIAGDALVVGASVQGVGVDKPGFTVDSVGDTFVVFKGVNTVANTTAGVDAVASGDQFAPTALFVKVKNKSQVNVTVRKFVGSNDAFLGLKDVVASKSAPFVSFANALDVTVKQASDLLNVDVTKESAKFKGGVDTTNIFTAKVDVKKDSNKNAILKADGNPAVAATFAATNKWTLAGPFLKGATVAGKVITDANIATAIEFTPTAPSTYLVPADNKVEIPTGSFTAVWTPSDTVTADYDVAAQTFAPAFTLAKNGDTAEVDLVLKPNGAYKQFVRITNDSTVTAPVSIKVINDAGDSAVVQLANIAGQPAQLAAGASTTQLTVESIFAASGLALAGEGKLRLVVDANLPSIKAQSYVLSTDNNVLSSFN
ncbi:MAG: hypothetical protein WBH20_11535 [Oceanisphaera sp.]|uniref:hypothetical protein n=1 Tax=Oceanisphaera sp. TaxID=1929979 RepID=UPI003C73AF2D